MTQQEIIENNRLIAEFMEYDDVDCDKCKYKYDCNMLQCGLTNEEQYEHLFYHESWDWLMPVVEKLFKISFATYDNFRKINWYILDEVYRVSINLIKSINKDKSLLYDKNKNNS